jgi:hypothetical protein
MLLGGLKADSRRFRSGTRNSWNETIPNMKSAGGRDAR